MTAEPAPAGPRPPVTDEGPARAVTPLTIEESARLVAGWARAESRLYEVLGGWAPSARGPATKIYFDVCSQHHVWRARLWGERRPGFPAHLLPTDDEAGPALAAPAIDGLALLEADVERLAAYCRVVLPRVVVGYRAWRERCSPVADQPVARALGFALADATADWERGSGLLAEYLSGERGEQAAVSAADASRQLDQLLARTGSLPAGHLSP